MLKQTLLYGLGLAALMMLLKYFEYSYTIKSFTQELYTGLIAVFFMAFGVWVTLKWVKTNKTAAKTVQSNQEVQLSLEISDREMQVLISLAEGLSNKEIAEKLFLSESTIKTHCSNLFSKLNVNRRTQAVQQARELGLID
ncbi:MAG: response regulator transcription factor [Flavobacteriales bacterium]|nr:response regulator transcription factor [Flavobacteriales bacterium]